MDIRIEKKSAKRIRLIIKGQDYTLGNLIQEALLRDDRIEGAGFYISHPLLKEMILEVRFKKEIENPLDIIIEDVEKFKDEMSNIKREIIKAVKGD